MDGNRNPQILRTNHILMKISAPLIVKNEAHGIQECLAAVRMVVDELIVLDTGSTDGTPELCGKYADRVLYSRRWTKDTKADDFDFAEARNEVLAQCHGDWILSVDADEVAKCDRLAFRSWLDGFAGSCAYVPMRFANGSKQVARLPRMFLRDGASWVGRYHDVPSPWDHGTATVDESLLMLVNRGGNDKSKLMRNLSLLKRQQIERGRIDATTFQIADTYRALGVQCYPEAIGYFEMCLSSMGRNKADARPYLLFALADCYARVGCIAKALDLSTALMREYPTYQRGFLVSAWCYERLKEFDLAICFYERSIGIADPMPLHPMFDEPVDVDAVRNQIMCCDVKLREVLKWES